MSEYNVNIGKPVKFNTRGEHNLALSYLHPIIMKDGQNTWASLKDIPANTPLTEGLFWTRIFSGGFSFKGVYDVDTEYNAFEAVTTPVGVYIVKTDMTAIEGEAPHVATDKWELLLTQPAQTLSPNQLLISDDNGDFKEIPIDIGYLKSTGTSADDVAFLEPDLSPEFGRMHVRKMAKGRNSYTSAFITSTDEIYTCGYMTTNLVVGTRGTSNSPTPEAVYDEVPHNGRWVGFQKTYYHLYAWTDTGDLYAIGTSNYGAFGDTTTGVHKKFKKLGITDVKNVVTSAPANNQVAVYVMKNDGTTWVVGANQNGKLGIGSTTATSTFTELTMFPAPVRKIRTCDGIVGCTAFILDESEAENLYMVGYNGNGNLGLGNSTQQTTPVKVPNLHVKDAYIGNHYSTHANTTLLLTNGSIVSAGYNGYGELGDGTTTARNTFVSTGSGLAAFVGLSGGDGYAGTRFGLTDLAGVVYAWGYNGYGQIGDGTTATRKIPVKLTLPTTGKIVKVIQSISYNQACTVFITSKGEAFHCGSSTNRQSGGLSTNKQTTPTRIPLGQGKIIDGTIMGLTTATLVQLLTDDGSVLSCGYYQHGNMCMGIMYPANNYQKAKLH